MIKRRFYKQEHVDHDGASDDSDSSSSDSDSPPHKEDSDDDGVEEDEEDSKGAPLSPPYRSGYESEDSSGNEVGCDSSGLPVNEEVSEEGRVQSKDDQLIGEETSKAVAKESIPKDLIPDPDNSILKFKSVFKCRLCPRIVCLSESTIRAHLSSKRHARSKKLLGEGRLKLILNSDGEIEEEQETHAERHARTIALAQAKDAPKKKDKGRKRQRKRRIKKTHHASDNGGAEKSSKRDKRKRRKLED